MSIISTLIQVTSQINLVVCHTLFKEYFVNFLNDSICLELDPGTASNEKLSSEIMALAVHIFPNIHVIDENFNDIVNIFAPTNWQQFTRQRVAKSPGANLYTYGDGVGLDIPFHYFDPIPARIKLYIKHRLALPKIKKRFSLNSISLGFFSTYLASRVPLSQIALKKNLENIYKIVSPVSSLEGYPETNLSKKEVATVLLTVNFFESGRLELVDEISSYINQLNLLENSGDVFIKHHPRDSLEKKKFLIDAINSQSKAVEYLNESRLSAFEWRLIELTLKYKKVNVIGFSTAVIGARLFIDSVVVGRVISQSKSPIGFRLQRLVHESELRHIIQNFRMSSDIREY